MFWQYVVACAGMLAAGWLVLYRLVRWAYLKWGRLPASVAGLQALLFFVFGGFPILYLADDWPAVYVGWASHTLGVGLVGLGLGGLLYGMVRLGTWQSMGWKIERLAQTGLYGKTRNPQALACGLYVLGFALLWPSWYAAGWAAIYWVLIHLMILSEESHLRRRYGEAYEDYCRRVARYWRLGKKRDLA